MKPLRNQKRYTRMSSSVNLFLFLEAANSGIVAMSVTFLLGIRAIEEGAHESEEDKDSPSFEDNEGGSADNGTQEVNPEDKPEKDNEGGRSLKESTSN